MILAVHQPQYLPWLGYFDKIAKSDLFVFLDQVQYKPREFQNRNKIRTKEGFLWLSVPVAAKGKGRQRICDCMIDNQFDWQRQHLNSLKVWYAKAPFFKEQYPFFEDTYTRAWGKLEEVCLHIISYCLNQLAITTPIFFESQIGTTLTKTDRIIELCRKLNADTYLSGIGGKEYLKEEAFKLSGVSLIYQNFRPPVYRQQFSAGESSFLSYLSIVDLLFNEGPRSREVLGLH